MKLKDLLENVNIEESMADIDMELRGVGCDSATIRQGELFAAIEGYVNDGHSFIVDAVKKGAICVICEDKPKIDVPYIKVNDSRKAFAQISAAWFGYPSKRMKLIGVTGTSGKTSTTHFIKHILEKCSGSKVGLIGTIGNFIGDRKLAATLTTPDSYELQCTLDKMALEGCEYVVMEVSSHALYLKRVYGIEYDIGIFTNLSPEHLDFHPTMEDYASAKALLFVNSKTSVVNSDDKYAEYMIKASRGEVRTYAIENCSADLVGKEIKLNPDNTEYYAQGAGKAKLVKLCIPGMFSVYNSLAAISAATSLGFRSEDIINSLFTCQGIPGRAEVMQIGRDYTVMVDYAHKPDALKNIIETARSLTKGNLYTLFGCGGDRDKQKRPLMGKIAIDLSDFVIVTSDNPRTERPGVIIEEILSGISNANDYRASGKLTVIENRREAISKTLDRLNTGDVLILAGKGHETYQIHGNEKIHFDDREVVEEHIRQARGLERKQYRG